MGKGYQIGERATINNTKTNKILRSPSQEVFRARKLPKTKKNILLLTNRRKP
jgi:hypothetical protein